jgi:hypothetical protein
MKILYDEYAKHHQKVETIVQNFLKSVTTLERKYNIPIIIFQDGKNEAYYIKCYIQANDVTELVDLE